MKILVCLILLSVVLAEPWGKYGLIVNYNITEIADEVLFIFKNLLRNVGSFDHKDINQETEFHFITQGIYIEDIELVNTTFKADHFRSTSRFDNMSGLLKMGTRQPVLEFLYKFNCRLSSSGVDLLIGEGTFSATNDILSLGVLLEDGRLTNEIFANFTYKLMSLNDIDMDDLKTYITNALTSNISKGLTDAFDSNRDLIPKYLFAKYKASYNSYKGSWMMIENTPVRWESEGQRIITVFSTRIVLRDKIYTLGSSLHYLNSEKKDIVMAVNQEFIFRAVYAMFSTDQLNASIDLKQLGYNGTIEEFYELDPNLEHEYPRGTKVYVDSVAKSFGYMLSLFSMYPMFEIKFIARNKTGDINEFANVLTNTTMMLKKKIVDGGEQLFSAEIENASFGLLDCYPDNNETKKFMKTFLTKLFAKTAIKKFLDLPKLRYEPIRIYKTMMTAVEGSVFAVAYTF